MPLQRWVRAGVLGVLFGLQVGCGGTSRTGAPRGYAQSLDSATNACRRNPLACARGPGEEPLLPLLPPGAASAIEATSGGWPDVGVMARIERILTECSQQAEAFVNEMVLGRTPTPEDCQKVLGQDAQGQQDTQARKLGRQKHTVARLCVQTTLEEEQNADLRKHVLLEPVYRVGATPGPKELVAPAQVERWRAEAPGKLRGTLVPDVVVHASGQPLSIQALYDFKFPCPGDREARWSPYPESSPYRGRSQEQVYRDYLAGKERPALIHPVRGIVRRVTR